MSGSDFPSGKDPRHRNSSCSLRPATWTAVPIGFHCLSEVLPRALLAELGLSKMLLGSSGGEQFLVVLPV